MPETPSMKIDIPGVDFRELARQAIAERITEALVGADDVVRKVVVAAMEAKVAENTGKPSQYTYENKVSYVEWVAQDMVRSATKDVLAKKVAALQPTIEREIEAALRRSIRPIARMLAATFASTAKAGYHITINVAAAPR